MGFKIIFRENADSVEMKKAISDFGIRLNKGMVGLFYFAGHGMQIKGQNYLIPVDALIENESDVEYEAINAGRILGKMEDARNKVNIVILDACRDNPFARSFRSRTSGLAKIDAPTGTIIAYATAPGSVAADGPGRNGIFTKYILKNIVLPEISVEEMFKRVRIEVLNETFGKQVPWESSSLTGYFYFNNKNSDSQNKFPIPKLKVMLNQDELQSDRDLIELQKKIENEKKLLEYERQLAAIKNERENVPTGRLQNETERYGVSNQSIDKMIGQYVFSAPLGNRTKRFKLVISKSSQGLKAKAIKMDPIRWAIDDFEVTNDSLDFILHKIENRNRDTFEVHGEIKNNHLKIPLKLELVNTDNPYSKIGYRTTGLIEKF